MKDYKEMTESVLQQAKVRAAQQRNQRRMATGLIASVLCLAILIAVIGVGSHPADGTQPTISVENPTGTVNPRPENLNDYSGQVYFLGITETGETLEPMQVNMTIPACSMIRVRSLKGMTKSEVDKVIAEENAFKASFRKEYSNPDGDRSEMVVLSNYVPWLDQREYYAVVHHLFAGKPSLILPNASEIKSVDTETTGVLASDGGYGTYNQDVTLGEGENAVTIPKGCLRLYLFPSMSNETMYDTFKKNPDTPLSTLRDTITVTVNYKNGTKAIIRIDVTVDDDGHIYMTRRGTEEWSVVYLSAKDGQESETPLIGGLQMPLDNFVYVRDLRGMNEAERQEAVEEWESIRAEKTDPKYTGVSTAYLGEDMIVATFMKGNLSVQVDLSKVQAVYVDNTNKEIAEKGWGWEGSTTFHMYWFLKADALKGDPELPLSSIHDTLNIIIMYRDGTEEVIPIDISINDEGQIFATLIEEKIST